MVRGAKEVPHHQSGTKSETYNCEGIPGGEGGERREDTCGNGLFRRPLEVEIKPVSSF